MENTETPVEETEPVAPVSEVSTERANFHDLTGGHISAGNQHGEVRVRDDSDEPQPERDLLPGEAAIKEGRPEERVEVVDEETEPVDEPGGDEPPA